MRKLSTKAMSSGNDACAGELATSRGFSGSEKCQRSWLSKYPQSNIIRKYIDHRRVINLHFIMKILENPIVSTS